MDERLQEIAAALPFLDVDEMGLLVQMLIILIALDTGDTVRQVVEHLRESTPGDKEWFALNDKVESLMLATMPVEGGDM